MRCVKNIFFPSTQSQKKIRASESKSHESVIYLLRKSVYSVCLIRPVLIMIVWKHCRSIAHSLQSVTAVIVAVRWQLYNIASSPSTFAPESVDKYFPSRDTSTLPSVNVKKKKKQMKLQKSSFGWQLDSCVTERKHCFSIVLKRKSESNNLSAAFPFPTTRCLADSLCSLYAESEWTFSKSHIVKAN